MKKIKALQITIIVFIAIVFSIQMIWDYKYNSTCTTDEDPFNASVRYVSWVNEFYKYNISNLEKPMTFDEIKTYGGVCSHYAWIYESWAKKDGFCTKNIYLEDGKGGHRVVIISNEKGHCLLSNNMFICF